MTTPQRARAVVVPQAPALPDRRLPDYRRMAPAARRARNARRVLALPFWVLLPLSVTAQLASFVSSSTWVTAAQILAPLLLVPISVLRAVLTGIFLRQTGTRAGPGTGPRRVGVGCFAAFGLALGTLLLMFATDTFAPLVVATASATATVAECHRDQGQGHHPLVCTGSWTADGIAVHDGHLPLTATPGSKVMIRVRTDDPYWAYAPLTAGRVTAGALLGLFGLGLASAAAFGLVTHNLNVNRLLRAARDGADAVVPVPGPGSIP
ncbi:hypothetical protein ABIA33_000646 [Streptacidiphilus sp. MAP12-16]|uniref:hypothetical protein n=1 Tax=Streptacidiphilus sp. MAP12-16 TaxID=3156300 RepID=UPI003519689C